MNPDLHTLTDAFAELERRADEAGRPRPLTDTADGVRGRVRPVRWVRPTLGVAALVVVAAAVPTVLVRPHGTSTPAVGAPATSGASTSTERTSAEPTASSPTTPTSPTVSAAASPSGPAAFAVPTSAAELVDRLQKVLAGSATFTVTLTVEPRTDGAGAYVVGPLTSAGVTGGFDLSVNQQPPGAAAMCASAPIDAVTTCTVTTLPDGSSLAAGQMTFPGQADVTNEVDLVRPDGVEFVMHVANTEDPKGASPVSGAQPPLTTDQMLAIVTSPAWST